MGELPLADIRVIDLTVARAGPACVRQLADWGADVIRVDPPAPMAEQTNLLHPRHGSDFQNLHRNKRSITIDLKTPEGQQLLLRLLDGADVFVENMRPGVKARLGFDYATVRARNPRVVYGSISGFGQDGPQAERGGVDQIAQGIGGLMSVTGPIGGEPTRVGIPVSDLAAGLYLAIGILVALHQRDRTGTGSWVRTSLVEAMIGMMDFQATRLTIDHEVPSTEGNHHPTSIPMGCFRTSDAYVNISASGGRPWKNFCVVIGKPDLPEDPRFQTAAGRSQHREELNQLVAEVLATRSTSEWVEALNGAGVPAGPVYRMDEVFADPQVQHLGLVAAVEHPHLGRLKLIRNPVTIGSASPNDSGPTTVREPSPDLGQHTSEVLSSIGVSDEEMAELRRLGVI